MIVVDTSVWIPALRGAAGDEGRVLAALLDADAVLLPAPVRTELLSGARKADRPALRRALTALPVVYPTDETWSLIDQWTSRAVDRGERFGMGDLLIGAMARENGALIWSLDTDFDRMAKLEFVDLYGFTAA